MLGNDLICLIQIKAYEMKQWVSYSVACDLCLEQRAERS